MKTMIRKLTAALAILALVAIPALAVDWADFLRKPVAVPVYVGADDDSALLLIRSFHAGGGSYTVAANALTFYKSAVGATTAEDEFECPVSGGLGGIIDTTDAACDTLGEIVDVINASTSWRAVILDGERSTALTATGLLARAQTNSNVRAGVPVYADSSTQLASYRAVVPPYFRSIENYLKGNSTTLLDNPFENFQTVIFPTSEVSAFSGGQAYFSVDVIDPDFAAGSETVSQIYNATSGTTAVWTSHNLGGGNGLIAPKGYKVLVKITGGTGTVSGFRISGAGLFGLSRN